MKNKLNNKYNLNGIKYGANYEYIGKDIVWFTS